MAFHGFSRNHHGRNHHPRTVHKAHGAYKRANGRNYGRRGAHDVKIIYRAENIIDANLVKGALAGEGIVAFVSGEYLTGAAGELPAWNLVSVMVADPDVERATSIAAAIDADLREVRRQHDGFDAEPVPA
jgi:Putative prokaryotic signal transducing protein